MLDRHAAAKRRGGFPLMRAPVLLILLILLTGCGSEDTTIGQLAAEAAAANRAEYISFNGRAEAGSMADWTIIANGGDGWLVGASSFGTSYAWDRKSQEIDLFAKGLDATFLNGAPRVVASEDFYGFIGPGNSIHYYLTVELRDAAHNPIVTMASGELNSGGAPAGGTYNITHTFSGYGTPVRFIYWEDGGTEDLFWAGHYGAVLFNASLCLGPGC